MPMRRGLASKGKSFKPLTDEQKRERKMKRVLGVGQAKDIKTMKKSSALKKISAGCKAAAKRKFKVWPSAYASGWGVRCTRAGGPGKMGKSKK